MKKNQLHIPRCFYQEILKLKNATIIYYVYHGSWNNLIQISSSKSSQYNIQSSHTFIQKLVHTCTNLLPLDSLPPLRNTRWSRTSEWFRYGQPWLHNPHKHLQCVCGCIECITIVTTDSQPGPFTYLSTRSPLDLTCM